MSFWRYDDPFYPAVVGARGRIAAATAHRQDRDLRASPVEA